MSEFMNQTMNDIRGGRETWRVLLACCAPSLAIAIFMALR